MTAQQLALAIKHAAAYALDEAGRGVEWFVLDAIREAVAAERERCACLAGSHAATHALAGNTYGALACGDVADEIRKGG